MCKCSRCGDLVYDALGACWSCLMEAREEAWEPEETRHQRQRDIEQTYRREVYGQ